MEDDEIDNVSLIKCGRQSITLKENRDSLNAFNPEVMKYILLNKYLKYNSVAIIIFIYIYTNSFKSLDILSYQCTLFRQKVGVVINPHSKSYS